MDHIQAAVKLQNMYRSFRQRRMLADTIIMELWYCVSWNLLYIYLYSFSFFLFINLFLWILLTEKNQWWFWRGHAIDFARLNISTTFFFQCVNEKCSNTRWTRIGFNASLVWQLLELLFFSLIMNYFPLPFFVRIRKRTTYGNRWDSFVLFFRAGCSTAPLWNRDFLQYFVQSGGATENCSAPVRGGSLSAQLAQAMDYGPFLKQWAIGPFHKNFIQFF